MENLDNKIIKENLTNVNQKNNNNKNNKDKKDKKSRKNRKNKKDNTWTDNNNNNQDLNLNLTENTEVGKKAKTPEDYNKFLDFKKDLKSEKFNFYYKVKYFSYKYIRKILNINFFFLIYLKNRFN